MNTLPPLGRMRVAVAVGSRPLPGEQACGDACESLAWSRGVAVAIADGLGHGPQAAAAARAFVACVRQDVDLPLADVFMRAHRALLKTRGAVAAVARFDEERSEVELAAVGNIGVLIARDHDRRTEHPVLASGVLGSAYRAVRSHTLPFGQGDVLLMHTDGVRSRFDLGALRGLPVQDAVSTLLASYGKPTDDAGCVIARGVVDATKVRITPSQPPTGTNERAIPVRARTDADCIGLEARTFARAAGLSVRAQWEVGIAASELATNIVKFAGHGEIRLRCEDGPRAAVVVEAIDQGSGIADVGAAIVDGFSEGAMMGPDRSRRDGQGLGVGLGSVHRLMDGVDIQSDPGLGTRIVARKFRG